MCNPGSEVRPSAFTLSEIYEFRVFILHLAVCILYFASCRVCAFCSCNCKSAVLVKLAPGEASRGRPDTIRRPFPVISGASKCDGDCDDVRMSLLQIQIQTQTQNHMYAVPMKMNTTSRFW